MARQYLTAPQGVSTVPDVPNWAWHDYGMRVGFWRLLEALTKRKIRATTSINSHVVESYTPVAKAMLDAGWEFMAHGVHPYISGVPHRIKYFEAVFDYMRKKKGVWFTTGEDIHEWYKAGR